MITTLLDAEVYNKEELAKRYNIRWCVEIDLRRLNSVMEMDVLRCKTPDMVRKEIWTHLLADNLIRTVIAKAAKAHKRKPYQISFKGTMQTINTSSYRSQEQKPESESPEKLMAKVRAIQT